MSTTGRPPNNQPLRPKLATSSSARAPLTPRVAAVKPLPSVRSESSVPRVGRSNNNDTPPPVRDGLGHTNITPRSAVRTSKLDSANSTPTNTTPSAAITPRQNGFPSRAAERSAVVEGSGPTTSQTNLKIGRPKSMISESGNAVRSLSFPKAGPREGGTATKDDSIERRFFHASDAAKQEPAPRHPEPKKPSAFFYADGNHEVKRGTSPRARSPVPSATSEQRSTGPWIKSDRTLSSLTSSPMLSPGLSAISQSSPFFTNASTQDRRTRSPSPTKSNIHLSYRKGASQIIGTRPLSTPLSNHESLNQSEIPSRRDSIEARSSPLNHHKSPSLSSIGSAASPPSQRRPAVAELAATQSPLTLEVKTPAVHPVLQPLPELRSINTSLIPPIVASPPPESTLSPTKGPSELAAEARRERKVLDLEISNSSLLAINTSLEREVRRQKIELKRFRRLSRAGRFSLTPSDRLTDVSEGLPALDEDDEYNSDDADAHLHSGLAACHDDFSDEDDEDDDSIGSSTIPTSPSSQSRSDSERLARDEKRLQVDLARHKELLVQSQMMNQSIKRCMYASEDMIREGKKALEYHVRVSDIKLGGRVKSNDEVEVSIPDLNLHHDETLASDDLQQAEAFSKVWSGVGASSHAGSDRDSGIDVVDRPSSSLLVPQISLPLLSVPGISDLGRPPGGLGVSSSMSALS